MPKILVETTSRYPRIFWNHDRQGVSNAAGTTEFQDCGDALAAVVSERSVIAAGRLYEDRRPCRGKVLQGRPPPRSRSAPTARVTKKRRLKASTTAPPVGTRKRVERLRPPTPARNAMPMLQRR